LILITFAQWLDCLATEGFNWQMYK